VNDGPVCMVFPHGVKYASDGLSTSASDDLVVLVGDSARFTVVQPGVVSAEQVRKELGIGVSWSSQLTDKYGSDSPMVVSYKRMSKLNAFVDFSSSNLRSAAEKTHVFVAITPIPAVIRTRVKCNWVELHDVLDTWRSYNKYRCEAIVADGDIIKIPHELDRSCVLLYAVQPEDVVVSIRGVRVGHGGAVSCNLLLGGGIMVSHSFKGKVRLSFRMRYVYDDYNYDGGGPSGSEDFMPVFSASVTPVFNANVRQCLSGLRELTT